LRRIAELLRRWRFGANLSLIPSKTKANRMVTITQVSIAGVCVTGVPILGKFLLWLNQKKEERDSRIAENARREFERSMVERQNARFVKSMATNHLPHLYNADKRLAEGLNLLLAHNGLEHRIEIDDAPPIDFVPFDPSQES
jgi:ABC-type uncharacterized transport system ATPase component